MCVFQLSNDNYENLLLKKNSKQRWDAIHFTAMSGSEQIFDLLEKRWTQKLKKKTQMHMVGILLILQPWLHVVTKICLILFRLSD